MWDLVKTLLGSKKFIATLLAVIAFFAAKLGLEFNSTEVALVIAPFIAYILGQGRADQGKAAEKLRVEAAREFARTSGNGAGDPS